MTIRSHRNQRKTANKDTYPMSAYQRFKQQPYTGSFLPADIICMIMKLLLDAYWSLSEDERGIPTNSARDAGLDVLMFYCSTREVFHVCRAVKDIRRSMRNMSFQIACTRDSKRLSVQLDQIDRAFGKYSSPVQLLPHNMRKELTDRLASITQRLQLDEDVVNIPVIDAATQGYDHWL